MQLSLDKFKPYLCTLCLCMIPFLLWYIVHPAERAESQYQGYGEVILKFKDRLGTNQWKPGLIVDDLHGKRLKLYTSDSVFNAYNDGDTVYFRCPLKNVTHVAEDFQE